ncbi:hypothetical protein AB0P36_34130 [Streptomyces flavidovirens]|uniref:hypothetical protein n=1 Tax=Streptomyces flavidovirens TaxID=67298 RepID=UPI003446ED19
MPTSSEEHLSPKSRQEPPAGPGPGTTFELRRPPMSEQAPSQVEGEQQQNIAADDERETSGRGDMPRTTPSQAEGEDVEDEERSKEWEAGWSVP